MGKAIFFFYQWRACQIHEKMCVVQTIPVRTLVNGAEHFREPLVNLVLLLLHRVCRFRSFHFLPMLCNQIIYVFVRLLKQTMPLLHRQRLPKVRQAFHLQQALRRSGSQAFGGTRAAAAAANFFFIFIFGVVRLYFFFFFLVARAASMP